jgi:hypothetical protein
MRLQPKPEPKTVAATIALILAPMLALAFVLPWLFAGGETAYEPGTPGSRFVVVVSESVGRGYADALAREAEKFTRDFAEHTKMIFPRLAVNPPEKGYIYYVRNMDELNTILGETVAYKLEYNDGFYDPVKKRIVLRHASHDRFERDLKALRHELTHLLMDALFVGEKDNLRDG